MGAPLGLSNKKPARRSPRNLESKTNMRPEKPNVKAFVPNKTKVSGINFQFSRQGGNNSTFNNSPSQNNIIKTKSSKSIPYKPYTGRLAEWNPKKTLEERKAFANKMAPKTKKGDIIKGVRLN